MVVYHFKCQNCDAEFSKIMTFDSDKPKCCPYCKSKDIENNYRRSRGYRRKKSRK